MIDPTHSHLPAKQDNAENSEYVEYLRARKKRADGDVSNVFLTVVGLAILGFVVLLTWVVITGNTFGQRCNRVFKNPVEIENCIKRLSKGGTVSTK